MSKLTKEQRGKLPLSDFGDPGGRLFPIVDQDDVDSAASLIGKAKDPEAVKSKIIAIAKRKNLSIPDAWKAGTAKHSVAAFSLGAAKFEDDWVLRTGKVFEAGEYQDKDFAITPEEMLAAVADFAPVPVDLEHLPTPLDGKLGELRSIDIGDDGWSLMGTVALPKWLDAALEGTERKVSATWDKATKTLQGLALVRNPRVSDAALMAAFAVDEAVREGDSAIESLKAWFASTRHDTPEGRMILQELHNTAARGGAVCKSSNTAQMASAHEASAVQKIHDVATEHGAVCSKKGQTNYPAIFTRKEGSPVSNAWDWLRSKLEGEPAPEGAASASATATMSTAPNAELESLKKRLSEQEAANAKLRAESIQRDAATFADTQIRERRAFPAEREAIIADFVQRATDDLALEPQTVTFKDKDGKDQTVKRSRVQMLEATFSARPQHGLTKDELEAEGLGVLMNRSETDSADRPKAADEKRVRELAEMTALGRTIVQNGKN